MDRQAEGRLCGEAPIFPEQPRVVLPEVDVQQPEEEQAVDGAPDVNPNVGDAEAEPAARQRRDVKHCFQVARVYCIETITWACGFPVAFKKFYKSEGEAQVADFLTSVWPAEQRDERPGYIAFDRACKVLSYLVTSRPGDAWVETTRFIVDAWHYINHRATDRLCRDRCNPAPKDGSQPDLVIVVELPNGTRRTVRAFNTEAAEQLNAWLKGYKTVLGKMTDYNHDFFLYCILFLYARDWERRREDERGREQRRERRDRYRMRAEQREEREENAEGGRLSDASSDEMSEGSSNDGHMSDDE